MLQYLIGMFKIFNQNLIISIFFIIFVLFADIKPVFGLLVEDGNEVFGGEGKDDIITQGSFTREEVTGGAAQDEFKVINELPDQVSDGSTGVEVSISGPPGLYTYAVSGNVDVDDIDVVVIVDVSATILSIKAVDDKLLESSVPLVLTVIFPDGATSSVSTVIPGSASLNVSISDASDVTEGANVSAKFIINVSGVILREDVTVTYITVDGTAIAGEDYEVVTNGVITFTSGTDCRDGCNKFVSVGIIDDSIFEGTEKFSLMLVSVEGGGYINSPTIIADIGTARILNTDCELSCSSFSIKPKDEFSSNEFPKHVSESVRDTDVPNKGEIFIELDEGGSANVNEIMVVTLMRKWRPADMVIIDLPEDSIFKTDLSKKAELTEALDNRLPKNIDHMWNLTALLDDGSVKKEVPNVAPEEICLPISKRIRDAKVFYVYHYVDLDGDGVKHWEKLRSKVRNRKHHICIQPSSFGLFAVGSKSP